MAMIQNMTLNLGKGGAILYGMIKILLCLAMNFLVYPLKNLGHALVAHGG